MLAFHAISDTGCVRDDNEDRVLADADLGFFVVADGMGGHRHGELAAELAISTLKFYLESSRQGCDVTWPFGYNFNLSLDANRLVTGIRLANRQVWKRAEEAPEYAGMGTTIAAAIVTGAKAAVANVGDSRVYLFRSGRLAQISIDDTWLSAVMQRGALDRYAIDSHPMRNVLTQAAGSQNDVEVHTADLDLQDGDIVVLTSDGLHGPIQDRGIQAILESGEAVDRMAVRLKDAARAAGGPDNISCILVRYNATISPHDR